MPHLKDGKIPTEYTAYLAGKISFTAALLVLCCLLTVIAVWVGPAGIPPGQAIRAILGLPAGRQAAGIIWHIRLPQALTAVFAGAGLAIAGATMQSILTAFLGAPVFIMLILRGYER